MWRGESKTELLNSQAEACYLLAASGSDWLVVNFGNTLTKQKYRVLNPPINRDM